MEVLGLAIFMLAAGAYATLFFSPASPVVAAIPPDFPRRALTGLATALTLVAIAYSPIGARSGAHLNPAVTLSFLQIGRVKSQDAVFYIAAQFLGGLAGVALAAWLLGAAFRGAPVSYIATQPGAWGAGGAFLAELAISFLLMTTILLVLGSEKLRAYTPWFAALLVFLYITFESPISGMSMNPARSVASALPSHLLAHLWIYLSAPLLGMQLAVMASRLVPRRVSSGCAKLFHSPRHRCIFCGFQAAPLLFVFLACSAQGAVQPVASGPFTLTVSNLDTSLAFYHDVLSFEKESEHETTADSFDRLTGVFGTSTRVATLRLGTERIQLLQFITPEGRPIERSWKPNDGWFQHLALVVSDIDQAYAVVRRAGAKQISTDPQTLPAWNTSAAGIRAFYFRDPDGHPLELIWFPAGKGDPRWQSRKSLFLGIDHSAIAVSDTDRSLAFYQQLLHLRVAGESLNYGPEQDHLNHTFGSRVRITALRPPAGPGIEFLEYLVPRDGRPMPPDSHPNDLWNEQTTILVDDLEAAAQALSQSRTPWVSAGIAPVEPLAEKGKRGFLVRDPDGHAILIRER